MVIVRWRTVLIWSDPSGNSYTDLPAINLLSIAVSTLSTFKELALVNSPLLMTTVRGLFSIAYLGLK